MIAHSQGIGFNKFMEIPWAINGFLEVRDDTLSIAGNTARELVEKHGSPLFVFGRARIENNIEQLLRLREAVDCKIKLCYAAKANSEHELLRIVRKSGADIEVNSGGELEMALAAGFMPDQIVFNGTSKTDEEIEIAISAGIYAIQADSFFEIELIEAAAKRLEKRANVSLRLVPEIKTDTLHGLQTALLTSKFGMMPAEALEAFRRWDPDNKYLDICGIHIHIGSQNPQTQPYIDALVALFENLLLIHNETGHRLRHLNLGGGFPVNYLRDDSHADAINPQQRELLSADLDPIDVTRKAWNAIVKLAERNNAEHLLENIELLLEPGRKIIADAGVCLTTVRNKKERPIRLEPGSKRDRGSDIWLLTDAGFNILLSMETYKWYYHLISADRPAASHKTPYKLGGPLCDGGDVYFDIEGENRLPDYRLLPAEVEVGELLALLNCGAYSVSQMFPYNGRSLPSVVIV